MARRDSIETGTQVSGFGNFPEAREIAKLMADIRNHKNKRVAAAEGYPEVVLGAKDAIGFLACTRSILNYLAHVIVKNHQPDFLLKITDNLVVKVCDVKKERDDEVLFNIELKGGIATLDPLLIDVKKSFILKILNDLKQDFETKAQPLADSPMPVDLRDVSTPSLSKTNEIHSIDSNSEFSELLDLGAHDEVGEEVVFKRIKENLGELGSVVEEIQNDEVLVPFEDGVAAVVKIVPLDEPVTETNEILTPSVVEVAAVEPAVAETESFKKPDIFWEVFKSNILDDGIKELNAKKLDLYDLAQALREGIERVIKNYQALERGWGFYWNGSYVGSPIHWSRQNIVESAVAILKNYLNNYKGRSDDDVIKINLRTLIEFYDSKEVRGRFKKDMPISLQETTLTVLFVSLKNLYVLVSGSDKKELLPRLRFILLPYFYQHLRGSEPELYEKLSAQVAKSRFTHSLSFFQSVAQPTACAEVSESMIKGATPA
ncbi:MAG TPA: hypothetical protein VD770_00095 [Coxiellaceae bacterium]|nr:hypothetical protein [Coxiellaceae bacterium]